MVRRANPQLAAMWRERLERQRTSGMSVAKFCVREGLSANSFYAWKRRLKGAAGRSTAMRVPSPPVQPHRISPQTTARVGEFIPFSVLAAEPQTHVEFSWVDGLQLRVPADNYQALRLVLETVQGFRSATRPGVHEHA